MSTDYAALQARLGYEFSDSELLTRALTHRSFANENPQLAATDNEKLEFLGDAVLDLVIGHLLMDAHPELQEGHLSVTRAQIVSESGLAAVSRDIDLGRCLRLGRGEERSGGADKPSLLADAFEAVIAAVYVDGGFRAAWDVVERLFSDRLAVTDGDQASVDSKTWLQEQAQATLKMTPTYRVVAESGPDHDKTFEIAVDIGEREWARASGKSKKEAEQRAAALAAQLLRNTDAD